MKEYELIKGGHTFGLLALKTVHCLIFFKSSKQTTTTATKLCDNN